MGALNLMLSSTTGGASECPSKSRSRKHTVGTRAPWPAQPCFSLSPRSLYFRLNQSGRATLSGACHSAQLREGNRFPGQQVGWRRGKWQVSGSRNGVSISPGKGRAVSPVLSHKPRALLVTPVFLPTGCPKAGVEQDPQPSSTAPGPEPCLLLLPAPTSSSHLHSQLSKKYTP